MAKRGSGIIGVKGIRMKAYGKYVEELEALWEKIAEGEVDQEVLSAVDEALDGQARTKLNSIVPLEDRRLSGAFFTSSSMAKRAMAVFAESVEAGSVILDPACGAGDLLLALLASVSEVSDGAFFSRGWCRRVKGIDLHEEFVATSKIRLRLWSRVRARGGEKRSGKTCDFDGVRQGDALTEVCAYESATHIVLNPPFGRVFLEDTEYCGKGLVSHAAEFVVRVLEQALPGTKVLAILPDVLRSGSRYSIWRESVSSRAVIGRTILLGQFDSSTDVDVFSQELTVRETKAVGNGRVWGGPSGRKRTVVGDVFQVSIGSVVDFRDPLVGEERPYVVAKSLTPWTRVRRVEKKRRFSGRTVCSPFVVVRRMSRVGDRYRAVATIIDLDEPAVVDNHLVVLEPRSGKLAQCEELMESLKDERTTKWLNRRIRCRHLTKASVTELPMMRDKNG